MSKKLETIVDDIYGHMPLVQEGIGRHQHEIGTVQEIRHLGGPYVRCIKNPSGYDLVNDQDGQGHDKPDKNPA